MSERRDREYSAMMLDDRIERAKRRLRELQDVLRFYGEESVSATAQRLGMSRDRVYWMQRVLGLRSGRIKSGWLTTRTGIRESDGIGLEAG